MGCSNVIGLQISLLYSLMYLLSVNIHYMSLSIYVNSIVSNISGETPYEWIPCLTMVKCNVMKYIANMQRRIT